MVGESSAAAAVKGQMVSSTRGLWKPSVIMNGEINALRGNGYLPPFYAAATRSPWAQTATSLHLSAASSCW